LRFKPVRERRDRSSPSRRRPHQPLRVK
jgi:hypothetical protein